MNRVHQDLEANFLAQRNSLLNGPLPNRRTFLGIGMRQSRPRESQGLTPWEFSIRFNVILLMVSAIKFLACASILAIYVVNINVRSAWVIINGIFELICSMLFVTRIINIGRLNNVLIRITEYLNLDRPNNPRRGGARGNAARNQGDQRRNSVMQRQNTLAVRVLKNFLQIRRALEILNGLWALVLIWGLITYGLDTSLEFSDESFDTFMLVFLVIGITGLAFPVLYSGCECCCRPLMLLIIVFIFGRPRTVPAPEVDISNLKIIKYSPDLPGENECIICRIEYEAGDKLVQLQCSPMHHMHEDCGKKWLRVNGQCPMCRADINSFPEDEQEENEQ